MWTFIFMKPAPLVYFYSRLEPLLSNFTVGWYMQHIVPYLFYCHIIFRALRDIQSKFYRLKLSGKDD